MIALALMAMQTPSGSPAEVPLIYGSNISCATAFRESNRGETLAYIAGLWSGFNIAWRHRVGTSTDTNGVVGEVRKVCEAAPSKSLPDAIYDAYSTMAKR